MARRLAQCRWANRRQLEECLQDDWEPFAVTGDDEDATVWLERATTRHDAGVEPIRPRLEREVATP
jgi:hypothetical protein